MKKFLLGLMIVAILFSCSHTEEEAAWITTSHPKQVQDSNPNFVDRQPDETGIYFINELTEDAYRNILTYQYYYNGGGVAAGDVNKDGKTDLFFTGNTVSNKLYLNQGNLKFQDVTLEAGLGKISTDSWCTGTNMADVNGDGWLDIYVCRSGNLQSENRENLLYINQGDGTFLEQAKAYGLNDPGYSIQSVFFDYDKDGDLDMFLVNHGMEYYSGMIAANEGGRDPYIGDKLYRNDEGFFRDVSAEAGIEGSKHGYGLGVAVADLNQDGWDDVYVANDFYEHDYLYLSNGLNDNGYVTFTESIHQTTQHISFFGMGVDLADFNNDALSDIVVLDMSAEDHFRQKTNLAGISKNKFWDFVDNGYHHQYMFNSLQLNQGSTPVSPLAFSNIAQLAGVEQTDWSWAPLLADFDNDGWKDLYITNGLRKDVLNNDFIQHINEELKEMNTRFVDLPPSQAQQLLETMPSQKISNYLYRNNQDLTFSNVSEAWNVDKPGFSNGAAYADLDNDGDLDLIVNNLDDFASIYENKLPKGKQHFLRIRLEGKKGNPFAYGAKAYVYQKDKVQYQQLYPSRGYQSSVEPILHFGLGEHSEVDSLVIVWPNGMFSLYEKPEVNRLINVNDQDAEERIKRKKEQQPWLTDVSDLLPTDLKHEENSYDDFDRQFLLPHKLSSEGPALAVADVNQDGLDDFYAGGASQQEGRLMLQQKDGSFTSVDGPWQADALQEDVSAIFFDADGDLDMDLYVVSGSAEFNADSELLQDRLYLNDGTGSFSKAKNAVPEIRSNGSCVASIDFDSDGDVDLFVGAGSVPGKYPYPDRSYLLENKNGVLIDVTQTKSPSLNKLGMIKDALWTDYDQDGKNELLVVGEWTAPLFFSWQGGELKSDKQIKFINQTGKQVSLQGWWHSVISFDIDKDGDQDYLLGNVGLNYRFSASEENPLEMYVQDMDENGTSELFMGYHQGSKLLPVHERDEIFQQWRGIKKQYPEHTSYAKASLQDILSSSYDKAFHLQADTLAHVILYNEGNGIFKVVSLPKVGQVSAVKTALFTDISGDGKEELLIAGNFYDTNTQTPRLDASLGQVFNMMDDEIMPVNSQQSGFFASGDVRKMVLLNTAHGKAVLMATNDQAYRLYKITSNANRDLALFNIPEKQ
ncbi:VCBS repeat-containing protein [Catalinimonas sp. 4WD22]|uniref:VCBS repeat-containing protein n=1 Tax=Catalinimonas locisalis TaxID=3133978 RepID=UPI0031011CCD